MSRKAKEETEREQGDAYLARVNADKVRRQQPSTLRRAAPVREENPVLLIVCQGTVTEVEYFKHFRLATAVIKAIGVAYDPLTLVQEAIRLRDGAKKDEPYEQVWCVFDKDDSSPEQFHAAIYTAANKGIEVAYSNQAFEFWLLLHFDNHQGTGMDRGLCGERVRESIEAANPGVSYNPRKGKHVSRELFELLEAHDPTARPHSLPRRELAVRRAQAIAERWAAEGAEPAYQESTTEVYRLVMVLQRHLEPV